MRVNQTVVTPLGPGVFEGKFLTNPRGIVEECRLVRMKLTDELRRHLRQSYCITPNAVQSALFVFTRDDVK